MGNERERRGRGGPSERGREQREEGDSLVEKVIHVDRVAKVVKGGRRFSFNAIVAVGDRSGHVGVGFGKANETTDAIRKATEQARKYMRSYPLKKGTIPHTVLGRYGAGRVMLKPAAPGTGVIAGSAVRAILETLGVQDILAKSLGSNNAHNLTKATMAGLDDLTDVGAVAKRRGSTISEILGTKQE